VSTELLPPHQGDPIPEDLIGATVVGFGTVSEPRAVPRGGLVIDYCKPGETARRRVVLGFNEIAMWVAAQAEPSSEPNSG
jgi:hypothetical protein